MFVPILYMKTDTERINCHALTTKKFHIVINHLVFIQHENRRFLDKDNSLFFLVSSSSESILSMFDFIIKFNLRKMWALVK